MPVVVAGAEGDDESVGEGILRGRAAAAVPLSSDEWSASSSRRGHGSPPQYRTITASPHHRITARAGGVHH
jgi:hypothetical protein